MKTERWDYKVPIPVQVLVHALVQVQDQFPTQVPNQVVVEALDQVSVRS